MCFWQLKNKQNIFHVHLPCNLLVPCEVSLIIWRSKWNWRTTNIDLTFLFFISTSALPQGLFPPGFTKALFGCPNNQQKGFNEPALMPVMIVALAPRECPPALVLVFPQLHATNESVVGMLHVCCGKIQLRFHWSYGCQLKPALNGRFPLGILNYELLKKHKADELLELTVVLFAAGRISYWTDKLCYIWLQIVSSW